MIKNQTTFSARVCGGHFEFLSHARGKLRGLLERDLEPKLRKSIGELSDPPRICESQTSKVSFPVSSLQ